MERPRTRLLARPGFWLASSACLIAPLGATAMVLAWLGLPPFTPDSRSSALPVLPGGPNTEAELASVDLARKVTAPVEWPETRVEGDEARRILLQFIREAYASIEKVDSYTAVMKRLERIGGTLGPEQTLELKVRHKPFSVYLHFVAPKKGREVLYVEGERDGNIVAHNGDWTRKILPQLVVHPESPLAMTGNRHPVTEAGLENLTRKLLYYREMDEVDPRTEIVIDRTTDEDGKEWYRSIVVMPENDGTRPFARVEVLYCPDLRLPLRIQNYTWPEPNQILPSEECLVERYEYEDVDLDAGLTGDDFDLTNAEYAFLPVSE